MSQAPTTPPDPRSSTSNAGTDVFASTAHGNVAGDIVVFTRSPAERRGWNEVRFIQDAGYSGKTTNRPGLRTALAS